MKDLSAYFTNPFSDPKLSREIKKKFSEDSIRRIITQNDDDQFDQLLADTNAAHAGLFGAVTNVDISEALQKARTRVVDDLIARFKARNTRLNKFFAANETDKTPVYLEFFPQGIRPFTDGINKANVEQRMQQMIAAITNHTAEAGGPDVLAEYQGFLSAYAGFREEQLTKISEVENGRSNSDEAEAVWNNQMFKNLLTFASLHRNEPGKITLYMNPSILKTPKNADHDGKGRITGLVTLNPGNQPLQGATVHVIDGNINDATTAADGSYTTRSLLVGTWQVEFSKNGFSKTETIELLDEGDTEHNVTFEPEDE